MVTTMENARMKLTAENVNQVLTTCLYVQSTPTSSAITTPLVVQGIVNNFKFDRQMLVKETHHIEELLSELPDCFKEGSSFMEMYINRDGEQWTGVIQPLEKLLALGIAVGKIRFLVPRERWWSLAGGMPYIVLQ